MNSIPSAQLLSDMTLFVQVGRLLSFQGAAKQLGLSASTLSRRIAALERSIGLRLFHRTTRRVALTHEGLSYFERCTQILDAAHTAHQDLLSQTQHISGTLRFSCTPDFATQFLPTVLANFALQYPHVRIEMDFSSRQIDLVAENVDFALRMGKLQDTGWVAKPIAQLPAALYANPSYLAAHGQPERPAHLLQHKLLAMKNKMGQSSWRLQAANQPDYVHHFEPIVTVASPKMLHALALQGLGVAMINPIFVEDDLSSGRLVRVLPEWSGPTVAVTMLTTSRLQPARVRVFGDFLKQQLSRRL